MKKNPPHMLMKSWRNQVIDLSWKKFEKKTPEQRNFSLLKTVFSSCFCKSTIWFLPKRNINSKWVIPNN